MYPGTKVNWIDQSQIFQEKVTVVDNKALFLTASTFDKGPEEMTRIKGDKFFKLYGTDNRFDKHGQPAIQAARIINAGGELLVKRIVADNATLPNVIFVAQVTRNASDDENIVPTDALVIPDKDDVWFGKTIGELVADDVVVDVNGGVHGTLHYVEDYVEFYPGNAEQQEGYYFPFTMNTTGTLMTLKVNGVATKTNIPFDPDILFRISDPTFVYEVEVDGVTIISLDFTKTVFEAKGATSTHSAGTDIIINDDSDLDISDTEVGVEMSATIKWSAVYIENCYSFDQFKEELVKLYDPENGIYPLIGVTDNGRGLGCKAISLIPNIELSTSIGKMFYTVAVHEGTNRIEHASVTLGDVVYNNVQYGINEHTCEQVKFYIDPDIYADYVASLSEVIGVEVDAMVGYDMINLTTLRGIQIDNLEVDPESIDTAVQYGVTLEGGSNGEFGDYPVDTPAWTKALLDFYTGNYTNEIYDVDEYKIGAVVDCCYPYDVKEAIAELATFREDFVFFRDMRCDADSYQGTLSILNRFITNNKFIANYMTYYQILDPATKKRIKVSMMYDFAACLVNAFNNGIHYPTAGIANQFILESAIEGTINYIPRITPLLNQKQLVEDLRVNYAVFQQGQCIVQSLYSAQEAYTQLSYINNVLAIQEVVRSLRTSCPKKRYTFVDNSDFSSYAELCENVLRNFKNNFDYLHFEYRQDTLLAHQKIFYASVKFAFKDWAQSEIFDVYAINKEDIEV